MSTPAPIDYPPQRPGDIVGAPDALALVRARPGFNVYVDGALAPSTRTFAVKCIETHPLYGQFGPWRCIERIDRPLIDDPAADAAAKAKYGDTFTFSVYGSVFPSYEYMYDSLYWGRIGH